MRSSVDPGNARLALLGGVPFSACVRLLRASVLIGFTFSSVPIPAYGADGERAPSAGAAAGVSSENQTGEALRNPQSRHDGFFFRLGFGAGRSYAYLPNRTSTSFNWAFEGLLGGTPSPYVDLGAAVFFDPAMDGSDVDVPWRPGLFGTFRPDPEAGLHFLGAVALGNLRGVGGLFGVLGAGYDVPVSAGLSVGLGIRFDYGWGGYIRRPGESASLLRAGAAYASQESVLLRGIEVFAPRLLFTLSHP